MLYIGIDVAKEKHDCCIIDDCGDLLTSFKIRNSLRGYEEMLQRVLTLSANKADIIFGLEDTGHYDNTLVNYLLRKHFQVRTVNPILTAQQKRSVTLRKTKTDSIDAKQLAHFLKNGVGFKPTTIIPQDALELKQLTRYRLNLIQKRTVEKTSVRRLVHIMMPELEQYMTNTASMTVCEMLYHYPSRAHIRKCHTKTLGKLLKVVSKGNYGELMARTIKNELRNSIGIDSEAGSYELKNTIQRIFQLTEEIKEIDKRLATLLQKTNSVVQTIPGIGVVVAATIIGEIGSTLRFKNPGQLLAYAGLSPTVYQSGKYINRRGKMEKRGSKYLRHALFLAARGAYLYCSEFRIYYDKKRSEGKHYYVALSHVAKKLIRVIYALEKTGQPYRPNMLTTTVS
ncbi:IS110 family transposase [Candidatus Saccharibacteria bacterium]|nr:IS110 family transposase [Candidatus Saccharibacteria bacterium]